MKTTITISLIVLAALVFLSRKDDVSVQKEKKEKHETIEVVKTPGPKIEVLDEVKTETVEDIDADMDLIEEKYKGKEVSELETILNGMEKFIESRNLFALANQGKLTEQDSKELSKFLRSKAVISQLLVEKKLAEVEGL